jgi:hypothetical protein
MKIIGGLFKRRTRSVEVGHYPDPVVNRNSSCFEVNNWIISDFVLDVLVPVVGTHPFPLNELMLMTSAVCRFKPTHIFEWGTNIGKSARIFYETIRCFDIGTEIHSVDLPDDMAHVEHPHGNRGMLVKGIDGVTLHQGDGLATSLAILRKATGIVNPLFFLDGDHAYETVKLELETIIQAAPASAILVHDTLCQSKDAGYNTGPHRAVNDIIERCSDLSRIEANTGLPGMTLLCRPKTVNGASHDRL